ncbi:hypothetical protein [Streptomyces griseus]|uniref:hypothetical protein n=1 Tax=Streptomyces griseus TaxID=1911 RepID=UPI00055FF80D|nr:hypothetical protein [Streptomyces griseus]
MTNLTVHAPVPADFEGDLASLRGDCARMVPHWTTPDRIISTPVSPALIHGVNVPPSSARLLEAMSDYGD